MDSVQSLHQPTDQQQMMKEKTKFEPEWFAFFTSSDALKTIFHQKMHLFQFLLLISLDHYCNTFYGFGLCAAIIIHLLVSFVAREHNPEICTVNGHL